MINKISQCGYIIIIVGLIFLFSSSFVSAQEEVLNLSLKDAIKMAIKASEDYKIESNQLKSNKAEYKKTRSQILPQISGSLNWRNNFEYPNIPSTVYTKEYEVDSSLIINQKLFTFGKVSWLIKSTKEAIQASRYSKENIKQKIIYNTKLAYYSAYLAKRKLEIARESYQNAKQNKQILQERTVSGRASKYDNIKISADIASRKAVVSNALSDYKSAIHTLKVAIGVEENTNLKLAQGFLNQHPELERNKLVFALYNNQPAIKAKSKLIEVAHNLVESKKAAFYPEISLFGTLSHKGSSNDWDVGQDNLEDYGMVGVKMDVPIWTSGRTSAELTQARIDEENAELEYKKIKENYLLELDKALSEYKSYLKTLKANKEAVGLAKESFKLSREMFKAGKISPADLNDAELKLTNEKLSKAITLFNISTTLAKIERLTLIGVNYE